MKYWNINLSGFINTYNLFVKKKLPKQIIRILLFCIVGVKGYSQDVAMHTQGIMQQEFLNPAYNAFKGNISVSVYNRVQWGSKFNYSPKSYVSNIYLPLSNSKLGINVGAIYEDIGLRTTTELKAGLCHKIRLSLSNFLSVGFGVGFYQSSFNSKKIESYPDEDLSLLLNDADLNTIYPAASVGMLLLLHQWYFSLSTMTTCIHSNNSKYFPGLDFSCGTVFPVSPWIYMRPEILIKYYNEKGIKSENGTITNQYKIPVIYDFSINFLIHKKIWIGTSHRLKQAQTFSLDMKVIPTLKIGYTFELGIGEGLNQFNSHGIRLSYTIPEKDKTKKILDLWSGTHIPKNIASFIY